MDHCHISGKYLGAAHNECNLKRRTEYIIPIFIHNLSRYDAHMIITSLHEFGEGSIECIPLTEEEYISFSKRIYIDNNSERRLTITYKFIDSYRFMQSSLDEQSSNLLNSGTSKFKNV